MTRRSAPSAALGRWAWRTLTSMRTAVMLLTLLALAAIPGSLLPQRNVATDPAAVQQFTARNPGLSPWLDRLDLFDVYASPWFAAIYVLLLVSMIGCVLPRSVRLWRAVRAAPPAAPSNLTRFEGHRKLTDAVEDPLGRAATHLRRRRFRVVVTDTEVRAERGYLREVGNLAFHLSLLVLLLGIALGKLVGFEGRVALAEGASFANDRSQYDVFTPSAWTDVDDLEPIAFRLERFDVDYRLSGPNVGQPSRFAARLAYRVGSGREREKVVSPNRPLDVGGTKFFLTGNGYAPRVTVRDGRGRVVFTGPVLFLPLDADNTSEGVIKVPDAKPTALAFEGLFLPTPEIGPQGPRSSFPDALDPRLVLTAFTGDLGLGDGVPQSVFSLDRRGLTQVRQGGRPFSQALSVGQTMELPDGSGSLTFDGTSRFANLQVAYDPGKEISLVAALSILVGLTTSLAVRRRRIWVRAAAPGERSPTATVELAGYSLTRRPSPPHELDRLAAAITGTAAPRRGPTLTRDAVPEEICR